MTDEFLFVYGSLRKAASQHQLIAPSCEFVSVGSMWGILYEVCGYPGAIESNVGKAEVLGEVYKMLDPNQMLAILDDYEECSGNFSQPHEYKRKRLKIKLAGGGFVWAWVYLYQREVLNLRRIRSGDYLDFMGVGG